VRTIGDVISTVVAARRFEVVLIGLFALTALLTASIGIYGIISHSLGQRANEVSIRMALGAAPHQLVGLVAREMMQPVLLGLAAGVGGSLLVGRAMSSLLFEVRPSDPATLAVVSIVLGAVAVLACWAPARRAMHADPADALRAG